MTAAILPKGLIIDLITPLKANGEIDDKSLERLLQRTLEHVQAVFLAGPYMGEGHLLDGPTRADLLTKALALINGRVPVLVWISQESEEKTRETMTLLKKARHSRPAGDQVCWVDTPLYYHSNRGLPGFYQTMITEYMEYGDSFVLHNDPDLIKNLGQSLKRNNIRTNIFKELTGLDGIKGLIFMGLLPRFNHYQRAARSRPGFRIYDGHEAHFLMYPSLNGVVSRGANLAPRAWQKVTASSLGIQGSPEYPDQLHQLWRTGSYLTGLRNLYEPAPVALIKQILVEIGVLENSHCLTDPGPQTEKISLIRKLMQQFGDW